MLLPLLAALPVALGSCLTELPAAPSFALPVSWTATEVDGVPLAGALLGAVDPAALDATAPARELAEVHVPRELRGVWVATVANLDFPSRQALPPEKLRAELDGIVAEAARLHLNALVFQVRPEADAFYASSHEPWSRYLTGKQGGDPGVDPLGYLVTAAHAQGIEVHAWFNPYRAKSAKGAPVHEKHVSKRIPRFMRPWGGLLWMDPGSPEVRDHALSVVSDVLDHYDIDGVHLDDYFYPYPEGKKSFPDDESWAAYRKAGGTLDREAWRADNVDRLVEGIAELVHRDHPDVTFGISPFGLYRPGQPAGTRGLDQVVTLHADPMAWYDRGWVDYLAPQLYWTTQHERQEFGSLLSWWDQHSEAARPVVAGLDVMKLGKDPRWSIAEARKQVALTRTGEHTGGQIWFRMEAITENWPEGRKKGEEGLADALAELYAAPALPPRLGRAPAVEVAPPRVEAAGDTLTVTVDDPSALDALVLYEEVGGAWVARRILGPQTTSVPLAPGAWAVSAVDAVGNESLAAVHRPAAPAGEHAGDAIAEAP